MYDGVITMIRSHAGETSEFPIIIGLDQWSTLSVFFFALVMNEFARHIQDDISWYMLVADDILLVNETAIGVNTKLKIWREALE